MSRRHRFEKWGEQSYKKSQSTGQPQGWFRKSV